MKKGISLVSLIITIIIMIILSSIIVITGLDVFNDANINTFAVEILNIQTSVDEYYYRYSSYPVGDDISINVSSMNQFSMAQFNGETITNNTVNLKKLNLSLIGVNETEFGNNETTNDVYALSETTGRVYYLEGVEYEGVVYYTITESLYEMLDATNISTNRIISAQDIKKYDVIFSVSNANYTNQPITVNVKIPEVATFDSVTATNSKSISSSTISNGYNTVTINATSADKNGNYDITVAYTYNGIQKTVTHSITNFDNTAPIITDTVSTSGTNKVINISATDAGSGVKTIKYIEKEITDATYFEYFGKVLNGTQIVVSDVVYTVYVEDMAGNYSTVVQTIIPDAWQANVTNIVDGVPIPKGFVASPYSGENKETTGLVIYELNDGEASIPSTEIHQTSLTTRNQYVWVPVDKYNFETTFVRKDYQNTSNSLVSNSSGKYYALGTSGKAWEVVPSTEQTAANLNYMTTTTLEEVQAMYASVREYGGFYIARYEAGLNIVNGVPNNNGTIYSMMNKAPYNKVTMAYSSGLNIETGGAIQACRNVYTSTNTKYGVVSTPLYSVEWDRTLAWWLETGAKDITGTTIDILNSTNYGNYADNEISTFNTGAQYSTDNGASYTTVTNKSAGTAWLLTTGATEEAKVNNIYDMAGNLYEWTMEGYTTSYRVNRGGAFNYYGAVCARNANSQIDAIEWLGFRYTLYIKK